MGTCTVAAASCSSACNGGGTIRIDGQSIFDALFDPTCFTMTDDCKYCPIQKLTSITNSVSQPGCLDYLDEAGQVSTWCPGVGMDTNTTYTFNYANMGGVFHLIVTDSNGQTVFNQPVPCNCPTTGAETLTSLSLTVAGNTATLNYLDENGNTMPLDLCPAVKACETQTNMTVVPNGDGTVTVTYLGEGGIPTSFTACQSCGTGGGTDANTTYTITGNDLVGSDGSTAPIPCTCAGAPGDTNHTYSIVGTDLVGTDIDGNTVSTEPIPCTCAGAPGDTNTTYEIVNGNLVGTDIDGNEVYNEPLGCGCSGQVTQILTAGNPIATYTGADGTTVTVYETTTTLVQDPATGIYTYTNEAGATETFCGRNWTRYPHCYEISPASTSEGCEEGDGTIVFREDFEVPSSTVCPVTPGDGLGQFTTQFDLVGECAPYWGQMFAEGIYMVLPGGFVPVDPSGTDPNFTDIHSNWLDFAPYSTGYAAFNLQPGTGVGGQIVLETTVDMTAGNCYCFIMHAIDTHTQAIIDQEGIALADLGLVVGGTLVGNTGPIGPTTTGTDSPNEYEVCFVATATGPTTMTLISNNSATNGNDIFMNFIKVSEKQVVTTEVPAVCGTGMVKEQLDCEGDVIAGTTVYMDADGAVLTNPTPCTMCN